MTSPVPEGTDEAVEAALAEAARLDYSGITRKSVQALVAAAAPYIAAKALRDAARELTRDCDRRCTERDCRDHAVWLAERADDIERAARAAGKDKTDGDH